MTRRIRLLWITASFGMVFLATAMLVAWKWSRPDDTYRPGERIEGITSDLDRSLPKDYQRIVFADVSTEAGIHFQHFSGTRGSQLPEDMGSGAAWGDYDDDGWLDLVVANEVGPISLTPAQQAQSPARTLLYRNNRDGTFTDVTDSAGLDVRGWIMAVAWADYDNDGDLDLVLTTYGTNRLYRNNGDGTFTDQSAESRIGGRSAPRGFWTGAAWGDYDRDGDLDLYITGYVRFTKHDSVHFTGKYDTENPASINPSSFPPERNLLYRNNGDGTFSEVARSAGVMDTLGRGLAATWADLDEDGWPDLYIANDLSDNVLYRNLGNGRFADISHAARAADYRSSMGIAVGDWDGDGDQDLFLTHWIAQENALHSNQLADLAARGGPTARQLAFMDEADRFGLGQSSLDFVAWATSFIDVDNDGRLDLFIVNGSTLQMRDDSTRLVPMRNQLFWNRGRPDGFFDIAPVAGPALRESHVGRGGAFGDYDNDGDVDVFIVNHGVRGQLLRNDGGNRNHWLQVEVRGTKGNRQGIGATVRVVANGRRDARQVGAQSPYLSQNSLIETFGLGPAAKADTVEVRWPGGGRDVRTDVPANQRIMITESRGPAASRENVQRFWELYREATSHRVARRIEAAAESYARALELNPDHEDVLYYYGSMRLALGDFEAPARAWRHLVSVNRFSSRTHSQLGMLYFCLDAGAPFQLDSAQAHFQQAHRINKEENGPVLRLGQVALARGDLADASRHFQTVLATHADNAVARFYSGYVAFRNGNLNQAGEQFRRAVAASAPRAPVGGVAGEGDTKRGMTPLTDRTRCDDLQVIADVSGLDAARHMTSRYRALDSLLAKARARAR